MHENSKYRSIGTIVTAGFIAAFFILLTQKDKMNGYLALSYPLTLMLALFSGGVAVTGNLRGGLKYLGLILSVTLIALGLAFLFRHAF